MGLKRWRGGKPRATASFPVPRKRIARHQQPCLASGRTAPTWTLFACVLLPWERHIQLMSLAEMTWCTWTVEQCIVAVGKGSTSKETFPVRHLFPFSICASVRNLLGHLVVNKNRIPHFSLTYGLCVCVYSSDLPSEKLQWCSPVD